MFINVEEFIISHMIKSIIISKTCHAVQCKKREFNGTSINYF